MSLTPGTRLGTYEILGPIGAGGMGEVYRAKDLRLLREVAVKVLPSDVASSPGQLTRLELEARTVAGLNHPNIVTLFSVEDEDGIRFLTMELISGQRLSDIITKGGLPLERVLEISISLADALAAAHAHGVIHRDLKPGNVMMTGDGRVKVLDFGLATVMGGHHSVPGATVDATVTVTSGRPIAGTLPYVAPELLRGYTVDARSDLFALGIILYELSTGSRPFEGATQADVIVSILRDRPKPIGVVRTDFPSDLERIVDSCLEKDPAERAQSALEVFDRLSRLRRAVEQGERGQRAEVRMTAPSDVASIAVLPFVNRSRDEEDEYFSDGLADELLHLLAKVRGLRVAARTSSFRFRATKDDVAAIGRKLNVATLLEGSVRKAGNRVRISVQLVKVSDGYHLWSETYDRTLEDIFAVQDDIAQSVVKELRAALLGEEKDSEASGRAKADVARVAKGRTTDPEAHRLYLQARHLISRYTRDETARGIGFLREALDRDPKFALAWAELGLGFAREAGRGWVPAAEGFERAREAATQSLALEPDLAEGHVNLGYIQMAHDWDWRAAEASYRRALDLAPGNAQVLRGVAGLALYQGRFDEAIARYQKALELDPLSPQAHNNLAVGFSALNRFKEAELAGRRALELEPRSGAVRATLAESLLALGRLDEALSEAEAEPDETMRLWALAIVHNAMSHGAESDAALRSLIEKHADDSAYQVAEVYAARGDKETAFLWLERALTQRDSGLATVKTGQCFGSLRDDPRWGEFLRRMGLN